MRSLAGSPPLAPAPSGPCEPVAPGAPPASASVAPDALPDSTPLPPGLGALAQPWAALSEVVRGYRPPADPEHCRRNLLDLTTLRNQIDALISDHVGKLDVKHTEYSVGECTDWLAGNLNLTRSAAYARVVTARELEELPHTGQAFSRGEITPQQVGVILCRALFVRKHLPLRLDEIDKEMAGAATQMSPQQLELHGRELLHAFSPQAEQQVENEQRDRRYLDFAQRWDGSFELHGQLDPEGGVMARDVLRGVVGKRPKDDLRSPGQARADAFVEIFSRILDEGKLPERGQERPHVTVLVDAATLREEPGSPPALLDWKVPVCGETAKRLLCDASARLALVGDRGDGTLDVLHLGRSSRTTSKRQRLALEIRDGGCLWPACGGHPKECTPHHFEMWSEGGPTDYENMGLNCPKHHW
ncbi:MAG: DUF222 domain-containing protein, partial [Candidatus Dormiibacterota bacterium]